MDLFFFCLRTQLLPINNKGKITMDLDSFYRFPNSYYPPGVLESDIDDLFWGSDIDDFEEEEEIDPEEDLDSYFIAILKQDI